MGQIQASRVVHGNLPDHRRPLGEFPMTTLTLTRQPAEGMTSDERRVIFASSLGTVFEWYDFYLYATLAPFFAALFFPSGNETAALLSAFATYAAGFLVRPFGAIVFGRIGDLVGRKYTFLVTIVFMGGATFLVGLLLILLIFSVCIRLKLHESTIFQKMRAEGKGSKSPLTDSFFKYPNNKYVLLALLGATAGQGVVWYTGQFYALFFLIITLKLDYVSAYTLIGISLLIGTPFFIVFGWLSDRIGRLKIILAGCLIAAVAYFPLFQGLTHYVNPNLEDYSAKTPITVAATECQFHIFVGPWSTFTDCDRTKDFLTKQGLSFKSVPAEAGKPVGTTVGTTRIEGWDQKKLEATLKETGYKSGADKTQVNWFMTEVILVIMVIYVTMVYGPIAAFLVELFPTKIRYTSMSLPYHIGNGWFGGMLPLLATALVAWSGNIYYGLWYPIWVSIMTFVIGTFMVRETRHVPIHNEH